MGRFSLSCFLCETLTKTKKTQRSPHNSVKKMFLLRVETVMKMGFFGGLQKGISGILSFLWERERFFCEVGLVGGQHLKTSTYY